MKVDSWIITSCQPKTGGWTEGERNFQAEEKYVYKAEEEIIESI